MTSRNLFENPAVDETLVSRAQLENLIELQSTLLGATVSSDHFATLLEQLCLFAEKLTPDAVASIMLLDDNKRQLFTHTAPSIPAEAMAAVDGLKVGDSSCGNAVFHNEDMYVCNTMTDVRWENTRDFAKSYNINACWSSPIRNSNKQAIGSFALSSFNIRTPDGFQSRLLNICASIAGIIFQRKEATIERKQKEKLLWESNQNLDITINSIAEGVISTDIHGNIIVFNQVAESLTGWRHENAVGQNVNHVFNIFNPDSGEKIHNLIACILDENLPFQDNNIMLASADGGLCHLLISKALIRNKKGETAGTVITFCDVTQQHRDRENLLESQQQYRSIVENTADALFLINDKDAFIDVNQAACDSLAYTRDELLTLSIMDIEKAIHEDNIGEFQKKLALDCSITVTGAHQRKDGSQFPVEVRLRRFNSNGKKFVVALANDITERKKAEEEIIKARKLDSIGLLAGGIAHDFNNLLGIILGNIDLAERSVDVPGKAIKYLDKATSASMRAADLTQQLLTFSKGGEPVKQAADIMEIIHESTDFSLHGSSIQVNYSCSDNLWNVDVDTGQMSQVMQNLVINARQAMQQGGKLDIHCKNTVLDKSNVLAGLKPGRYIKLTVGDSGEGISKEIIHSIFDPYFTTKQRGSGLGLALTYSIIQKHNGCIFVDSEQYRGAVFTVYLPVSATGERVAANKQKKEEKKKSLHSGAHIMLMDDDEMIREISTAMLENLGYEVIQAEDGRRAYLLYQAAMKQNKVIDLVIMDLTVLNGVGGKEAIKLIQQIDPEVKALVSSGYSNDPVMANYSDYGFKGAVSKPYSQDRLGIAVSSILNQCSDDSAKTMN